jgi:hypothetical protein
MCFHCAAVISWSLIVALLTILSNKFRSSPGFIRRPPFADLVSWLVQLSLACLCMQDIEPRGASRLFAKFVRRVRTSPHGALLSADGFSLFVRCDIIALRDKTLDSSIYSRIPVEEMLVLQYSHRAFKSGPESRFILFVVGSIFHVYVRDQVRAHFSPLVTMATFAPTSTRHSWALNSSRASISANSRRQLRLSVHSAKVYIHRLAY